MPNTLVATSVEELSPLSWTPPLNTIARLSTPQLPGRIVNRQQLDRCHVLMTFPVHNEAARLQWAVDEVTVAMQRAKVAHRLAIAEDGSTDGTKALLGRLRTKYPALFVQELEGKRGRGYALRSLWSKLDADIYAFSDVDLATGTDSLIRAIKLVETGTPVVIGSRYVPGAVVNRPPLRCFVSKQYNRLTRFIFGIDVHDHQCGLKVFSRDVVRALLPLTLEDSWFWDTEIIVLARKFGFNVAEIPVVWVERKSRQTRPTRLLSDVVVHGAGLMRLKSRIRQLVRIPKEMQR